MKLFKASQSSVVDIEAVSTSNQSVQYDQRRFLRGFYCYSGLQALFVTVLQTSVDLLCKKSYKSSSLLGYFDYFLSNHLVGCCNINFSCLSQMRREKLCFASNVSIFLLYFFCVTAVVSMPRLANFSPCDPLIFCFNHTLYGQSL